MKCNHGKHTVSTGEIVMQRLGIPYQTESGINWMWYSVDAEYYSKLIDEFGVCGKLLYRNNQRIEFNQMCNDDKITSLIQAGDTIQFRLHK